MAKIFLYCVFVLFAVHKCQVMGDENPWPFFTEAQEALKDPKMSGELLKKVSTVLLETLSGYSDENHDKECRLLAKGKKRKFESQFKASEIEEHRKHYHYVIDVGNAVFMFDKLELDEFSGGVNMYVGPHKMSLFLPENAGEDMLKSCKALKNPFSLSIKFTNWRLRTASLFPGPLSNSGTLTLMVKFSLGFNGKVEQVATSVRSKEVVGGPKTTSPHKRPKFQPRWRRRTSKPASHKIRKSKFCLDTFSLHQSAGGGLLSGSNVLLQLMRVPAFNSLVKDLIVRLVNFLLKPKIVCFLEKAMKSVLAQAIVADPYAQANTKSTTTRSIPRSMMNLMLKFSLKTVEKTVPEDSEPSSPEARTDTGKTSTSATGFVDDDSDVVVARVGRADDRRRARRWLPLEPPLAPSHTHPDSSRDAEDSGTMGSGTMGSGTSSASRLRMITAKVARGATNKLMRSAHKLKNLGFKRSKSKSKTPSGSTEASGSLFTASEVTDGEGSASVINKSTTKRLRLIKNAAGLFRKPRVTKITEDPDNKQVHMDIDFHYVVKTSVLTGKLYDQSMKRYKKLLKEIQDQKELSEHNTKEALEQVSVLQRQRTISGSVTDRDQDLYVSMRKQIERGKQKLKRMIDQAGWTVSEIETTRAYLTKMFFDKSFPSQVSSTAALSFLGPRTNPSRPSMIDIVVHQAGYTINADMWPIPLPADPATKLKDIFAGEDVHAEMQRQLNVLQGKENCREHAVKWSRPEKKDRKELAPMPDTIAENGNGGTLLSSETLADVDNSEDTNSKSSSSLTAHATETFGSQLSYEDEETTWINDPFHENHQDCVKLMAYTGEMHGEVEDFQLSMTTQGLKTWLQDRYKNAVWLPMVIASMSYFEATPGIEFAIGESRPDPDGSEDSFKSCTTCSNGLKFESSAFTSLGLNGRFTGPAQAHNIKAFHALVAAQFEQATRGQATAAPERQTTSSELSDMISNISDLSSFSSAVADQVGDEGPSFGDEGSTPSTVSLGSPVMWHTPRSQGSWGSDSSNSEAGTH